MPPETRHHPLHPKGIDHPLLNLRTGAVEAKERSGGQVLIELRSVSESALVSKQRPLNLSIKLHIFTSTIGRSNGALNPIHNVHGLSSFVSFMPTPSSSNTASASPGWGNDATLAAAVRLADTRLSTGVARPDVARAGTILALAPSNVSQSDTPVSTPRSALFERISEVVSGMKVLAPGIVGQFTPSRAVMGIHLMPAGSEVITPQRYREFVRSLAESPELQAAIRAYTIVGKTPSRVGLKIFADMAKRLSEMNGGEALEGLSELRRAVQSQTIIPASQPLVAENDIVRLALHSSKPHPLQWLSYRAKQALGHYPEGGRWYRMQLEYKASNELPSTEGEGRRGGVSLDWCAAVGLKHVLPTCAFGAGIACAYFSAPLWVAPVLCLGGFSALGMAFRSVDKVERRAAKWFPDKESSTSGGK